MTKVRDQKWNNEKDNPEYKETIKILAEKIHMYTNILFMNERWNML